MAGKYGHLKEFLPDEDSIGAYLERASLYFVANGIEADKRVPILLSSIGAWTYSLLRDLIAPDVPSTLHLIEFRKYSLRISSQDTWW